MKPAIIEIKYCKDCSHCDISIQYIADSFERPELYMCRHPDMLDNKKIAGYVEWYDKDITPPEWCLLRKG